MAGISSITSSPSIDILVNQFLAVEKKPIVSLQSQKEVLQKRISILTDFKTELTNLNDRFKSFTTTGTDNTLSAKKAVSSNESLFTVQADSKAVAGVYSLKISQLARNDTVVSKQFTASETKLAKSLNGDTANFKITLGSGTPTSFSTSFADSALTNQDILSKIAAEINGAGIGVSASVIKDTPTTVRLSLVSKSGGSSNAISLEDFDKKKLLANLGFINSNNQRYALNGTNGGYVYANTDNLNAKFSINGIDIVGDSNTVTDIMQGVTLTLRKAQTADDQPETISITSSSTDIVDQVKKFIENYNKTINYIASKTSINATTHERGPLTGDFAVRNLFLNLRSLVAGKVSTVKEGNPQTLREIGIKINNNGTLELSDENKLKTTVESDSTKVTDLFNSTQGIATRGQDLLKNFISTGGTIDDIKKGTQSQASGVESNISRLNKRVNDKEVYLRREFTDLQRSLSRLNSQSALLQNISSTYGQNYTTN